MLSFEKKNYRSSQKLKQLFKIFKSLYFIFQNIEMKYIKNVWFKTYFWPPTILQKISDWKTGNIMQKICF